MFRGQNEYDSQMIRAFFVPQVTPEVLAERIPGETLHVRSMDAALRRGKTMIGSVLVSLQDSAELSIDMQESFGYHLSAGCIMIAGALDGMAILDARTRNFSNLSKITFTKSIFLSETVTEKQKLIKSLRSPPQPPTESAHLYASQDMYVDFFSVMNFWKHFMPLPPAPTFFARERVFDFQLEFGGAGITIDSNNRVRTNSEGTPTACERSGPIIRDLLIPTYDAACDILHALAKERGLVVECCHFHERQE
jgi:hypothetical protein